MFYVVCSRYYYDRSVIFIIAFISNKYVIYFKPKKKYKLLIEFLSIINLVYIKDI